jgi:hypothetical protein
MYRVGWGLLMQITFDTSRAGAMAAPAISSVRRYTQTGWRLSLRFNLFAYAMATLALLSMYQAAEAQVDLSLYEGFFNTADSVRDEIDGILKTEKCLFEFRAEELTKRLNDTIQGLSSVNDTAWGAREAKQISGEKYLDVWGRVFARSKALKAQIRRVKNFPRCLNFVGSPPGRLKMQGDARPEIGRLIVEPKISVGLVATSGNTTYDSTGGQAPFNGDWSHSTGQVCGGATFYPGFVIGPARVGLDVNVCSGSNTFGSGDTTLFRIMRHGPGDVDLRSSTNVVIDTLFKAEVPLGDPQAVYDPRTNSWFLSVGIGPSFREQNLTLTSDQSFFGGGVPSISATTWQSGFVVSTGISTFVCPTCIAGNPLKVGIEGRARFFPSQSNSLHSIAFAFEERGSTGSTTDYSAQVTFSVPIAYGGDPIADRFGKH